MFSIGKRKSFLPILLVGALFLGLGTMSSVLAYSIEDLGAVAVENDFTLGPGKLEVSLSPGEETSRIIAITNRLGKEMGFVINIEDFKGSRSTGQTIILLGEEKGPYSLKDYLHPDTTKFTLKHGQRINLPIKISIPEDAEPGGLYGSVLVATAPPGVELGETKTGEAEGGVTLVSRLGALFFVRVKGAAQEDGFIKDFRTINSEKFYDKGPITFELLFENNGNVHLTPYGIIEIKNLLGKTIDEIEVDPWFAMPDSLRVKEVKWDRSLVFGRYVAIASVNRGYEDIIDQKSFVFWVIPWKIILVGLIIIFSLVGFFFWISRRFEIRRKS